MPRRHPVPGQILAVSRVLGDVIGSHDRRAVEGRRKYRSVSWHGKACEGFARHAGECVQQVALANLIADVVEEGAKLRSGQLDAGISHELYQALKLRLPCEGKTYAIQDR